MPRIHTVAADGTITSGDKLLGSDGAENANFVTRNYTVGGIKDFVIGGTHAGSFTTLTASETLAVTGNSTLSADLSVGGNLTVTGNATITGNLTFGDADTDTVSFAADVTSNIIPDITNTYNLGNSTKKWKDIHLAGDINSANIILTGTVTTSDVYGVTSLRINAPNGVLYLDSSQSVIIRTNGTTTALTIDSSQIATFTAGVYIPGVLEVTNHVNIKGQNELRFWEGANYIGFEAPALAADQIWVLPAVDGSADQVLKTDGSGNLGWAGGVIAIPHIIGYSNNTNSVSIGYSSWAAGGPQTGDGGAIENVAVGIGAMNSILQGDGNIAVGYNAGTGISFGDFNIVIGHKAGASIDSAATGLTTGKRNIIIGANSGVSNVGTYNAIIIGTHHDIDNGDGIIAESHQTIIGNDETKTAVVKGLRQEVRTSPATDQLSDVRGTDANKITLLDSTSAITITLPDSGTGTEVGKTYTFVTKTAATGGAIHKIVCADTTNEKIIGGLDFTDGDTATNFSDGFIAASSNNYSSINLNGTTQGGVEGSIFSLTCVVADLWVVSNSFMIYSGSQATPFATT
jgi:hypothetical protein